MNQATQKSSAAIGLPIIAFRSARLRTAAACLTMAMLWVPVLSTWMQVNARIEASNASVSVHADAQSAADEVVVNASSPSNAPTDDVVFVPVAVEEITDARLSPVSVPQGAVGPTMAAMAATDPVDRLRGMTRANQLGLSN